MFKKTAKKLIDNWGDEGFQKYFRNTGWMFVGQMSMIISLIINIWLARYFGPEKYGSISYIFAFVGVFSFISTLGIGEILVRELVKNPEKKNALLGTSFYLLTFSGFLAFLISSITGILSEPDNFTKILIVFYSTIFIWSPVNVIAFYFQAKVKAKRNAYIQITGTILVSLFKIIVILSGKGMIWIIFAFILDYVVGGILYIIHILKYFKFKEWYFDKFIARNFISSSLLLMLSGAMAYLLLKIDQIMIKFYLQKEDVGIYAAAVKLSEIWYFIPGIISNSLLPAIVNAQKIGSDFYKNRLKKLYILLISISLSIALITTILAPFIIKILYGNEYIRSTLVLQIYIWSIIGSFVAMGINKHLITENHLKTIFFYNAFSAILNIILNAIFIPKLGIIGSAYATLISYSVGPILVLLMFKLKIIKNEK